MAYIVKPNGSTVPIQMLRDTGALQSVLKQSAVDESSYTHTGETRLIKGISKEVIEIPLVELHLRSPSFDHDVLCGLVSELPEEVDFLCGNDLDPDSVRQTEYLEESVITRAQAAAQKLDQHQHDNSDHHLRGHPSV